MQKGQLSFLPESEAAPRVARGGTAGFAGQSAWELAQAMPEPFVALDRDGNCLQLNAAAEELLGAARAPWNGRALSSWPEGAALAAAVGPVLTHGRRSEVSWTASDGRGFRVTLQPNEDGTWLFVREAPEDRSVAFAQAAREAETDARLLRQVLETLPAPLVVARTDGTVTHNAAAQALFSTGGAGAFRPLPVVDGQGCPLPLEQDPVARVLGGERLTDEYVRVERAGDQYALLTASGAPVRDASGRIVAAACLFQDVTDAHFERNERDTLLVQHASELEKLRAFYDHMPCGLFQAHPADGSPFGANLRAREILGRTLGEGEGVEAYLALRARRLDGTTLPIDELPPVRAALKREWVPSEDFLIARPDGSDVVVRMSAAPIADEEGRPAGVLATFLDVTAEVRLLQEREQERLFREMFIGMLGHDLRTPLSAILTSAEIVERTGPMSAAQARATERIRRSSTRMANMITQVVDLTRARFGGTPITRRLADVGELCTRATDECCAAHPGRTVDCRVDGVLEGLYDEERLLQLLGNLLDNAVKHGLTDMTVRLRAWAEPDAVLVEVHNLGRAIPPEQLPTLFDPFKRGAGSQGLGLGLYIARQIALAHGGDLRAHSDPRTGTTFTVWLPRG